MKTIQRFIWGGLCAAQLIGAEAPLFKADFTDAEVGKVPSGFRVLDGGFAVREEGGNRFLELPGAPLESYGALFGPAQKDGVIVSGRILGTAKGRRFPTFAVGLGGASGYRLQVSPGKKRIELWRGEEEKASVPFDWQSGKWTHLQLQARKVQEGLWKIEGRVWVDGAAPLADWMIAVEQAEEPRNGQAAIFGSPFAGTPIAYDDLSIAPIGGK
jgi:hypothetical protein